MCRAQKRSLFTLLQVPKEFQTQVPNYANPPTLTMAVTALISRLAGISNLSNQELGLDTGPGNQIPLTQADLKFQDPFSKHIEDPEITRTFLTSLYPNLKKHYEWFRRTQRGQIKQYSRSARSRTEGYRWRGRTETHVLTSGMDDYPRGPPHAGELHLDLISWMGFFSRTMREVASFIGENDDALSYTEIEKAIIDNIEDLHWNEDLQMYCDANVDDNGMSLSTGGSFSHAETSCQMIHITSATKDIYPSSHSSWNSCPLHRPISALYLISFVTLTIFGLLLGFEVYPHPTPNSARAKTTGGVLSGYK